MKEINTTEQSSFTKEQSLFEAARGTLLKIKRRTGVEDPDDDRQITICTPTTIVFCDIYQDVNLQKVAYDLSCEFRGLAFRVVNLGIVQKIQCYGTIKLSSIL